MDRKIKIILVLFLAISILFYMYGHYIRTTRPSAIALEKGPYIVPSPEASMRMIASQAKTITSTPLPLDRKIIQQAHLGIQVKDFQSAFRQVESIAVAAGGYISNSDSKVTQTGHRRGIVTIRVPKSVFRDVIQELESVGNVKTKSISGEDVTEEYIDLEARLRNYESQEERLLEILEKANTVDEILRVEEQLGRVRGEIERITGRMRFLDNRVELATITVELFEPEPITQSWGTRDALRDSLGGFIAMTNGLIVMTGYMLPLLILFLIGYSAYKVLRSVSLINAGTS
jgi:hypothetical protein